MAPLAGEDMISLIRTSPVPSVHIGSSTAGTDGAAVVAADGASNAVAVAGMVELTLPDGVIVAAAGAVNVAGALTVPPAPG